MIAGATTAAAAATADSYSSKADTAAGHSRPWRRRHGAAASAFASGLAAIDAVVKLLESGDEILAVDDIYGGAFRLFTHIYAKFGIKVRYADTTDVVNVLDAIN